MLKDNKEIQINQDDFALFLHQDFANLIAQAKVFRWDMVKWSIATNLGVIGLLTIANASQFGIVGISFIISLSSAILMWGVPNKDLKMHRENSRSLIARYSENNKQLMEDVYKIPITNQQMHSNFKRPNEIRAIRLFYCFLLVPFIVALMLLVLVEVSS